MCDSLPFLLCFLLSFQQQFNFFEECFQDGAMEIVVPPCPSQELQKRMHLFSFFSFLFFYLISAEGEFLEIEFGWALLDL